LLIKLGYVRGQVPNAPGRNAQSRRGKGIAQKIEPIADPADVGLCWVLFDLAPRHDLVDLPNSSAQLPTCGRQHYPVIHETGIEHTQALHPLIKRLQVERAHQG